MKPPDIGGVFSRLFVVGFFLPSFFSLSALGILTDGHISRNPFGEDADIQVLVLGGLALLAALVLQGVWARVTAGATVAGGGGHLPGWLFRPLRSREQQRFDELERQSREGDVAERATARVQLRRRFPSRRDRVLGTRIANAFRATQDDVFDRYGLDVAAVWRHIELMLDEREERVHDEAKADQAFFAHLMLGALIVAPIAVAERLRHEPLSDWRWWFSLVGLPLSAWLFYRAAVSTTLRWHDEIRASVDLHRADLYDKLGLPRTAARTAARQTARALNRFLLYGEPRLDDGGAPEPVKKDWPGRPREPWP
jgi:hypothetical protein